MSQASPRGNHSTSSTQLDSANTPDLTTGTTATTKSPEDYDTTTSRYENGHPIVSSPPPNHRSEPANDIPGGGQTEADEPDWDASTPGTPTPWTSDHSRDHISALGYHTGEEQESDQSEREDTGGGDSVVEQEETGGSEQSNT